MDFVIDIAFVIATVAFVGEQTGLKGKALLGVAFAAVSFIAFLPDLVALFPQSQYAVEKIIFIVKLFLSAPGLWDAAGKLGAKLSSQAVG